jgi:Flp pilus assembly pilin Flp
MLKLYLNILNWLNSDEGQDLAEYALLLGLIAVIVMAAVVLLGEQLFAFFNYLQGEVGGWIGGGGGT